MNYHNTEDVHLMVWEENPKKRNVNNVIKFNLPISCELKVNDRITTGYRNAPKSEYAIDEIINIKPSSLSGYNYCTAKSTYTALSSI